MRVPTIKRILRDVLEEYEEELAKDYYGNIENVLNKMALSIQVYCQPPYLSITEEDL